MLRNSTGTSFASARATTTGTGGETTFFCASALAAFPEQPENIHVTASKQPNEIAATANEAFLLFLVI
jgi:hypothetical protein